MKVTSIITLLTLLVFISSEFGGAYAKPQGEPVELSRTVTNQEVEDMLRNPFILTQFFDKSTDFMVSVGHMIEELKNKWSPSSTTMKTTKKI
ncbi:hypothetical protein evm_011786 [Chilo suppressalis]|nr:hypothetical protein evm_011786 [Chilo suppressalis]